MNNLESKEIENFKNQHADLFAWIYSNSRSSNGFGQDSAELNKKILNMASLLDNVEYNYNLVDAIRKKVGINPIDIAETKIENIFPDSVNTNYQAASGWGEYIRKVFSIDIGAIEELFDEIIAVFATIYDYIKGLFAVSEAKTKNLLDEINIITETLKNMRNNTPLLVHMQTKLEMSQSAKMSVA